MNQTTPMNTATAGGAMAIVMPLVAWADAKLNLGMPLAVQSSLTVLLISGAHWLSNYFTTLAASCRIQGATQ